MFLQRYLDKKISCDEIQSLIYALKHLGNSEPSHEHLRNMNRSYFYKITCPDEILKQFFTFHINSNFLANILRRIS